MAAASAPAAPVRGSAAPAGGSCAALLAEGVEAALLRWGVEAPAEAFAEMCARWPGLLAEGVHTDVLPRLAQLEHLVREAVLAPEECARLTMMQPRILSAYTIRVLWERDGLVAVAKPFDMRIDVPKGEERHWPEERTVADWFAAAYPDQRVRFCHQLDHATSGVLLMASSKAAGRIGSQLFEQRRARKTYLAVVLGRPAWLEGEEVALTDRLADGEGFARHVAAEGERGEEAETRVRLLQCGRWPQSTVDLACSSSHAECEVALVEAKPITGRRHQIRLHLAAAGYPILGDDTYGGRPPGHVGGCYRMFLHALRLELPLPSGETVLLEAPCSFESELA